MTRDQVKAALDRVLSWPQGRQHDVMRVLSEMEEQDRSGLRLPDEEAAEVRRRLANPSDSLFPAEKVFDRFRT